MKRSLCLFSIFILMALGCSKAETKLVGKWKSGEVNGFVAEFKKDHTGTTFSPIPGHAGMASTETAKTPFTWTVSSDGTVKINEAKDAYSGKLAGNKLEIEVNGARTILEKAK